MWGCFGTDSSKNYDVEVTFVNEAAYSIDSLNLIICQKEEVEKMNIPAESEFEFTIDADRLSCDEDETQFKIYYEERYKILDIGNLGPSDNTKESVFVKYEDHADVVIVKSRK